MVSRRRSHRAWLMLTVALVIVVALVLCSGCRWGGRMVRTAPSWCWTNSVGSEPQLCGR